MSYHSKTSSFPQFCKFGGMFDAFTQETTTSPVLWSLVNLYVIAVLVRMSLTSQMTFLSTGALPLAPVQLLVLKIKWLPRREVSSVDKTSSRRLWHTGSCRYVYLCVDTRRPARYLTKPPPLELTIVIMSRRRNRRSS
jgi:hypothetical protein